MTHRGTRHKGRYPPKFIGQCPCCGRGSKFTEGESLCISCAEFVKRMDYYHTTHARVRHLPRDFESPNPNEVDG